jgi:hypothetical protein
VGVSVAVPVGAAVGGVDGVGVKGQFSPLKVTVFGVHLPPFTAGTRMSCDTRTSNPQGTVGGGGMPPRTQSLIKKGVVGGEEGNDSGD